ncbi:SH3 domain-containing protein [Butyricicoccus sp.]|uniref:SH3 domain-containing protein n=1 Tax=Butyricicoccus sp. TaxID=2049021 RepID=UPI003F168D68
MKKLFKKMIAIFMSVCISISGMTVRASAAFGSPYNENYSVQSIYQVVDSKTPVRYAPSKNSAIEERFIKGSFFRGKQVINSIGNKWIKVELEDGCEGFVSASHVRIHNHSYVTIARCSDGTEIRVCACGAMSSVHNGKIYVECDVNDALCQWAAGEYSSTSSVVSESLSLIEGEATSLGMVASCGAATLETAGAALIACGALIVLSAFESVRDISANINHKDYLGLTFNVAGTVTMIGDVLEITEINKAVKHSSLYNAASTIDSVNKRTTFVDDFLSEINGQKLTGDNMNVTVCELVEKELPVLSNSNYPSKLSVGQYYSIRGVVNSNSTLRSVSVGVYKQSTGGDMITGKTFDFISSNVYDLKNSDSEVYFNHLASGTYYYRVTATNAAGTIVLLNKKFTVQ